MGLMIVLSSLSCWCDASQWRSKEDYDAWLNSKEFKDCTAKIEEVLDVPGKRTTIFRQPNEDIFLL